MQKNRFMVRLMFATLFVMTGMFSTFLTPVTSQAKDVIELKAVTSFPRSAVDNLALPDLIKMIEKRTDGRLKINYIGGPEVVKTFDQAEALRRGNIDMILFTPLGYLKSLAPELQAKGLSKLTAWEERRKGVNKIWDKILQDKVGAKYLGNIHSVVDFSIYSNKKMENLADFKGMKIRAMPLYTAFLKELGAKPIIIPPTDIYTAMQRGVVDGFIFSTDFEVPNWGWHEVTKYKIIPGIFQLENGTLVNLKKFNSLPKDCQEALEICVEIFEGVDTVRIIQTKQKAWEVMKASGVQEIVLPEKDAKKLVEIAESATWAAVLKDAPEMAKVREMISKK